MRLCILGCGGFIGSHLVNHLADNPRFRIAGFDRDLRKLGHAKDGMYRAVAGDIYGMLEEVEQEIADSDAVVFLASLCNPALYMSNSLETIRSNFIGPHKIVDLCAKHGKWLISFSTCEVYGMTLSSLAGDDYKTPGWYIQTPETPSILGPVAVSRWSYAATKQLLDRYILAHHQDSGMPYTIIRPYNFFGSRMDFLPTGVQFGSEPRILASFLGALVDKRPLRLVDGGVARRVYTDIEDAVIGISMILTQPRRSRGKIMHIANPRNECSVAQMAGLMRQEYAREIGATLESVSLDSPLVNVTSKEFYGSGYEDCDRRVPDISAMKELGWSPLFDLNETVHRAVSSYLREVGVTDEETD